MADEAYAARLKELQLSPHDAAELERYSENVAAQVPPALFTNTPSHELPMCPPAVCHLSSWGCASLSHPSDVHGRQSQYRRHLSPAPHR